MCFADDLLIFTDGSASSVANVLQVLKEFEERSGLAMSIQKTYFFTAGLRQEEIDQIKSTTNLSTSSLPICYLGVPLCTKKINLDQCSTLMQSIKSKLHSWTVRSLSFVGRLQLISSVILEIPISGRVLSTFLKVVSMKLTLFVLVFCGKGKWMVKLQLK